MRYYSYNEMGDNGENLVVTLSEEDVRKQYWPYWYGRMCERFGKDVVDEKYAFEDCLDDWVVVNWAWEVKECIPLRKGMNLAVREKYWWEHYPLHQVWCNDACPLVPRFEYRPGDDLNANSWSLHWLIFKVWTLEHFAFGAEINLAPDSITIGFIVPYLRIFIGFHHMWQWTWLYKLGRMFRRKPALKNEKGEYN